MGGMYGVAQGALFCGESMFSRAENASKTALLVFCQDFAHSGGKLIDCGTEQPYRVIRRSGYSPPRLSGLSVGITRLPTARAILGAAGAISADNKMFSAHFASGWYNCAVE